MKDTQPILIISTGRTGTIFFSRLFADLYPDSASYHERGASRPVQILTNLHFSHLFPKSGLKTAWKLLKGNEIETCEAKFHIDANCFLYGLAPLAPELYPNLKVLHIVRDPRSYVTSHLNFSRQKGTSFIANYFVPFWQPNPFLVGELPLSKAIGFTRFEKYCWIWDFKNRVMEGLENTSTPYMRVRFEDLFNTDNPEDLFGRITDFLGLPRVTGIREKFRQPANTSSKTDFPEWPDWTPKQAAQLQALCGARMAKYGYGGESEWEKKVIGNW
ncbi:MAG TPA: sulfotransferase domain-containing protein [Anaerolineales bacterium]|nr:sulfotransferase domain-containing protein [Anaerolineales bacterium]HNB86385.1 sulfotransferase domain-containing protein [Anaerolineales bacterium]HNC88671.1 sulfotransferase domain-containing protein [Anaerolineales bacterium]HND91516.1 sulfotransferase domain-containing protein [Anaerolineales bacterium]HNH79806.1 sulfotransferase domain-containing protein [Anaerolineales bacterium]